MVSYEQAKYFIENVLEISAGWEDLLQKKPLDFLKLYMVHHSTRIPFQNVSMAAVDVDKRKRPTEAVIIKIGMLGRGGCCLHLNFFSKIIFCALGLDAIAIIGTHARAPVQGTHCMVAVKLNGNELYLIEVGGAFPILDPVPMHKLPFKVLASGGYPNEFREVSPGIVGRYTLGGGLLVGDYIGKQEALRTSWDLVPRELSHFDVPMQEIFTNVVLLRNPLMGRYFSEEEFASLFPELCNLPFVDLKSKFPDCVITEEPKHFVFVFKRIIVVGDAYARKIVKEYKSYSDMVGDIKSYFPKLHVDEITKAFKAFDQCEILPSFYDTVL